MARLSLLVGLEPWKNLRLLQEGFCKTSKKKINFLTYDHHVNLTQAKNAVQCGFPMHHYCYRRQKNQVSFSVFTVSTNNVFFVSEKQVSFCVFTGWYFSSKLLKSILTQDHIGSGLPRCLSERPDSVQQRVSLLLGSLEAGLCLVFIPNN